MKSTEVEKLRRLTHFEDLVAYLRDELDWPIEVEDAEEITFDYDPAELGIDPKHAVKIESIRQIRPLADNQPWGIFYVQFESKRLPVVVLRRILRSLVPKSRQRDPNRPVWRMSDLLFISAQGEPGHRSISFAHFRRREGRVAELRTFSWDTRETHFYYIKNLNLEALRWPEDEASAEAWRAQWGEAFSVEHRYTIRKSQELARQMARQAGLVRDMVEQVYELETTDGPLHSLYADFREALLHDLTPESYADMVAQTVAYGLFSAATQTGELSFDRVVDLIPNTNPFLKELLAELTTEGAVDLEELGVGQLVELLRQTDVEAILQDFGRQTGGGREDPVVHFYELFLSEYDKKQKVQRGVFYTPDPAVYYIVRSVDYLLKEEFGLEDGLADSSVQAETGEPLVQILDVATGTGTFLAHVIDEVEDTVKGKPGVDWNEYVAEHLLPRLNGFELMMAPYAVAHMKLGLKLRQTGYDFASDERLRVYLTNTLEEPMEKHEALALTGFLSKESNAAARVKRRVPITVVIGNPPYSKSSANQGEWIESLMEDYKETVREEETQIQALSDDYAKFIRFAHWRIDRTGDGVIALITNNGYLDGPLFRDLRCSLLRRFERIWILNLHGDARKKELPPNGGIDENVFDIQQGVSILLLSARQNRKEGTEVLYSDLWGSRKKKYRILESSDASTQEWLTILPVSPHYLFVPVSYDAKTEWDRAFHLYDVFGTGNRVEDNHVRYGAGFVTQQDEFAIAHSPETLYRNIEELVQASSESEIRSEYRLCTTNQWSFHRARLELPEIDLQDETRLCAYRPFDFRYTIYDRNVCTILRERIMRLLDAPNLALLTTRRVTQLPFNNAFVTDKMAEYKIASHDRNTIVFPLYFYPDTTSDSNQARLWSSTNRVPNLSPAVVSVLARKLRMSFAPDDTGDLQTSFGPDDVFHYLYAILHSPSYRTRYGEFLKIDFPRLPITSDVDLLRSLVSAGADLVALHLLEDGYGGASWNKQGGSSPLHHPITSFVERQTGTKMGKFSKRNCYQDGRVYLDTSSLKSSSYFEGVPEDIWEFRIGGYQVLRRWLWYRRETPSQPGRVLTEQDVSHYQRIVVALKETMRLMEEIDKAIDAHGGWPIE